MKRLLLLITLVNFFYVGAQTNSINYKALIKDGSGNIVASQSVDIQFIIYQGPGEVTNVYQESHTVNTDVNGIVILNIGEGTTINVFSDINWALEDHYLNVQIDTGDGLTDMGTTKFATVPYTKAIGKWQAHKSGLKPKGTGGSIYIGENAGLTDDFSDNHNIGIGNNTLTNSTSFHNIAIGNEALMSNDSGWNNLAVGPNTLKSNTSGNYNLALGVSALSRNTTGSYNLGLGASSLFYNTTGSRNIAIGRTALSSNIDGSDNIALGYQTMRQNTAGIQNIAFGRTALYSNESGNNNISFGFESLYTNTVGNNNVAIGLEVLRNNRDGNDNIGLGKEALRQNITGSDNVSIGRLSLSNNTGGSKNVAVGNFALTSSTISYENVAIGANAMEQMLDGGANTALGAGALKSNSSGDFNVAIGYTALGNNSSGVNNTAVGIAAGFFNQGSRNVFIGNSAGLNAPGDHKLFIENSASDTPLIYGEFDNDILGLNAKVGVGTQTPSVPLHIVTNNDVSLALGSGTLVIGEELGQNIAMDRNEIQARSAGLAADLNLQVEGGDVLVGGAIVQTSDKRLKRDIENISYGLDEILKLRPTEYFWKKRVQKHKSLGLIAQEVDEVIKNVVSYNEDEDKYGVNYVELIPVLIKAMQEQQQVIKLQQRRNNAQSKELSELKSKVNNIEVILSQMSSN